MTDGRAGPRERSRSPCRKSKPRRPLEAKIVVRVGEPGGRAVERIVTLPIRPKVRPHRRAQELSTACRKGRTRRSTIVVVSPDGARIAGAQPALVALPRRATTTNGTIPTGAGASNPSSRRAASPTVRWTRAPRTRGRISAPVGWGTLSPRRRQRRRIAERRPASASTSAGRETPPPTRPTFWK